MLSLFLLLCHNYYYDYYCLIIITVIIIRLFFIVTPQSNFSFVFIFIVTSFFLYFLHVLIFFEDVLKDFPFFEESHIIFSRMSDEERNQTRLKLSLFLDNLKEWTDYRTRFVCVLSIKWYFTLLYFTFEKNRNCNWNNCN